MRPMTSVSLVVHLFNVGIATTMSRSTGTAKTETTRRVAPRKNSGSVPLVPLHGTEVIIQCVDDDCVPPPPPSSCSCSLSLRPQLLITGRCLYSHVGGGAVVPLDKYADARTYSGQINVIRYRLD